MKFLEEYVDNEVNGKLVYQLVSTIFTVDSDELA